MEKKKLLLKQIITICLISKFASVAHAQENRGFSANAVTSLNSDDNIYRVISPLAKEDQFVRVQPEISILGKTGKQTYELTYEGDFAEFKEFKDAAYRDHNLEGKLNIAHSIRLASRFEAGYSSEHEEPGSINRIQLDIDEYNKYDQKYLLVGATYGRDDAFGQILFNFRKTDKNYKNNGLNYLDFASDQYTLRFTYRLAPKTTAYVETIQSDLEYERAATYLLDNSYDRYQAGLTWNYSEKISGDINIGYQKRDYKEPLIRDINGLAYNADIDWIINTYTKLNFNAKRQSIDSSLEEAAGFLRTTYGTTLNHELTELTKLKVNLGYSTDELVFTSDRQDDRYNFELDVSHDLSRYFDIGISYLYQERKSTDEIAKFKSNMIRLYVEVAFEH